MSRLSKAERQRHTEECAAYLRSCTDQQVRNILADEKRRGKLHGPVGAVARIFAQAAREELLRRGLEV